MLSKKNKTSFYYNIEHKHAVNQFSLQLIELLSDKDINCRTIIILCIGSDRATGDCLGPIIGYKLSNHTYSNVEIIGTLKNPVHAQNLDATLDELHQTYDNPIIIAIDACLGKAHHIGMVNLGLGTLSPGSGVNKKISPVGDIFITGIVNFSGYMDLIVLQNTRLNLVMELADFITTGIHRTLSKMTAMSEVV